ncbi:hypothetical protein CRYUN_Cryun01aG0109000 [Craigia yunnanensis]
MAQPSNSTGKKLIRIDVSSDSVCPWCFVGKRNLDKAIAELKDQFDFVVKWHPFFLDPSAPKEGVNKREFYERKGNTLESHRLINFAGKQGFDKQHNLVEELFLGYFTQGIYIGDREFLLESARKVGVEGAAEFLENPNNGVKEVNEELEKYSANISGVPNYTINGKHQLSGGQPPEAFMRAFQVAAK